MKLLGIQKIIISNASGCLNPAYKKGDLMVIEDHINLQNDNPLRGRNYDSFGPRFPDMSAPYDLEMNSKAMAIAKQENITMHSGVYVSVNGPNLETKAEYKFLRLIGADVVGMSTVPEVIVANHMQIPVFAISVITDEGFPEILKPVSLAEIIAIAQKAEPKMTTIIKKLIALA
jgi:purine-nucleoside phosphorylase